MPTPSRLTAVRIGTVTPSGLMAFSIPWRHRKGSRWREGMIALFGLVLIP